MNFVFLSKCYTVFSINNFREMVLAVTLFQYSVSFISQYFRNVYFHFFDFSQLLSLFFLSYCSFDRFPFTRQSHQETNKEHTELGCVQCFWGQHSSQQYNAYQFRNGWSSLTCFNILYIEYIISVLKFSNRFAFFHIIHSTFLSYRSINCLSGLSYSYHELFYNHGSRLNR